MYHIERQGFVQSINALCDSVKATINQEGNEGVALPKDLDLSKLNLGDLPETDESDAPSE